MEFHGVIGVTRLFDIIINVIINLFKFDVIHRIILTFSKILKTFG